MIDTTTPPEITGITCAHCRQEQTFYFNFVDGDVNAGPTTALKYACSNCHAPTWIEVPSDDARAIACFDALTVSALVH